MGTSALLSLVFGLLVVSTIFTLLLKPVSTLLFGGGEVSFIELFSGVVDNGRLFLGSYRTYIWLVLLVVVLMYFARWILSIIRGDDLPSLTSHRSSSVNGKWSS